MQSILTSYHANMIMCYVPNLFGSVDHQPMLLKPKYHSISSLMP